MPDPRPLGWNPELLPPDGWELARRHVADHPDRFVGGEAALAGFWLHHRTAARVEIVVRDQAALEALQAEIGRPPTRAWPGFCRYREADLTVDHSQVLDARKPQEGGIRADSLRDLAADRMLRLATAAEPELLADLYFLSRARVDLLASAREAATKDLGLTPGALAVVLARARPVRLPPGLIRPVESEDLEQFVEDLIVQLGMEVRP